MQTLKSESSKHNLDGNSIFHGKKFEPPNDSMKHLHKSILRKETPESRQDNERIPFPPTHCSRRSTHKAENTFGRLLENAFTHKAENTFGRLLENAFSDVNSHNKTDSITRNDIQFNKDLHNERQSATSTPKDRSFQEKVHVRQGEPFHNEIPRKQENSKKNEGSSNFLYKERDCLIPLKDQNGYDSIGSIRNSRNTYDDRNYGGGKNRPMTHKRSSERKITKVDGNHYDTSSYMHNRG